MIRSVLQYPVQTGTWSSSDTPGIIMHYKEARAGRRSDDKLHKIYETWLRFDQEQRKPHYNLYFVQQDRLHMRSWLAFVITFMILGNGCAPNSPSSPENTPDRIPCIKVENVVSIAYCRSPAGPYTTEVHADTSGYLYFRQAFGESDAFVAVLPNAEIGLAQDSAGLYTDTLPMAAREMIRSHAFHLIALCPELFYTNLSLAARDTFNNRPCDRFTGIDRMGNAVSVYLDGAKGSILGLSLKNSLDTSETIQVIHDTFRASAHGPLVEKLRVVQAERDTFHFDFDIIEINSADFQHVQ